MTSKRIHHVQEYYFSGKLREIADLQAQGKPVINLGIGSPDLSPPEAVKKTMSKYALSNDTHQYQSYRGRPELRQAISRFYKRHYAVELDAGKQILPLTGSKEGILHLSMALLNKGDQVLIPDPGYMTYHSATLLAEAVPVPYQLNRQNNYLPDFEALEQKDLSKVKLMWVNYPHMPTGTPASTELFEKITDFARRHNILVINDNPYSFILTEKPLSILQVPNALDVAAELNSLSKSHNMAGWRVGMLSAKKEIIDAVMKFKSQMDSGMFLGTQMAAVKALDIDENWYQSLNATYEKRKKMVLKICQKLRLKAENKQAGLFVWAQLPQGISSKDFTDRLLYEKDIFITPGFIFGQDSDSYVRISLTSNENILQEVLDRIDQPKNTNQ